MSEAVSLVSSPRALCGLFFLFASAQCTQAEEAYFKFRDTHKEAGLSPDLAGMVAHSAAWGDVDGDGWADLYVGSFYKDGGIPSLLFRNNKGKFSLDGQENLRVQGRASGGVFADLDNDGDLDYYHSNNAIRLEGPEGQPNRLFRNEGGGKFTDITESSGAFRPGMTGRSVSVFDLDGDGLLDLLASEGPFRNKSKSSCIFRNKGNLKFEELDESIGLPTKIPALGTAVGDVNNDGWPDFFLASRHGSNRLFLNDGKGRFREAPGAHELFDNWKFHSGDGSTCGVVFGDVNRDGLLDVLMGSHYKRPWMRPAPIKLFLNRGIKDGNPSFEDVSVKAGLHPLALKAPHIEIQDFNNDSWPDIMVSIVKFADGKPYPVIFKHLGIRDGLPRFDENAMAVNDFPTATDRATGKTGEFYKKMEREKKITYAAPMPTADYDLDGRLDIFLASWWRGLPSMLLKNETPSGKWLRVKVIGGKGMNRMGIGTKIRIYPAGKAGELSSLIGFQEICAGYGYSSGQEAIAHFGLGDLSQCDMELELPHTRLKIQKKGIKADQLVTIAIGE